MGEVNTMRLSKVLRELNISMDRAMDYLKTKGHEIEARPTTKISDEIYEILSEEFQTDKSKKVASKEVSEEIKKEKEELRIAREKEIEEKQKSSEAKDKQVIKAQTKLESPKTVGKIDLGPKKAEPKVEPKVEPKKEEPKVAVTPEPKVVKETVKEEVKEDAPEEKKEAVK